MTERYRAYLKLILFLTMLSLLPPGQAQTEISQSVRLADRQRRCGYVAKQQQ